MYTHLKTIEVGRAKKDYLCSACDAILSIDSIEYIKKELTESELIAFEKMEQQNFQILKGQAYTKVIGVCDGELATARYGSAMYGIADRLGCFED